MTHLINVANVSAREFVWKEDPLSNNAYVVLHTVKKFENRPTFVKVMNECIVAQFFWLAVYVMR